jgi:hypothetical protein
MKGRAYEELVRDVLQGLPTDSGQVQGGVRNKIIGASGYEHQIDISIHAPEGLHLIECKHWTHRLGVQAVLTHAGRLIDIQSANPGVVVTAAVASTQSVTRGARVLAQHFGVTIDTVSSVGSYVARLRGTFFAVKSEHISMSDDIIVVVTRG